MKLATALLLAIAALQASAQEAVDNEARENPQNQGGLGAIIARHGDLYKENCAVCHGESFEGAAQGTPLIGNDLTHGDSMDELVNSISEGFPDKGMPAWGEVFTETQIQSLALWIKEHREGMLISNIGLANEITLPTEPVTSERHKFKVELVADGFDMSFSIAPLPDGSLLLTEKVRGLSIVSPHGTQSPYIEGTPKVYPGVQRGSLGGLGWLLEVALDPNYEENGWIYLQYSHRCEDCNAMSRQSKRPVSMNALVRGRIDAGKWVDEEMLWQAPIESYSSTTDIATGGRTAIDPEGFVFISVGFKTMEGVQNLASPHGKIHRMHLDGRIPSDNPFVDNPEAMPTIWSYGHRSPQGLDFDPHSRTLWGTEHGPRGGDEINLLQPGKNYGWPSFSIGQNYDGSQVDRFREDLELELKDVEQPVVDLTPSPGVSSLIRYSGAAFPGWQGDFIVATLKASDLYRVEIEDGRFVRKEVLIENLARIRDVEADAQGNLYLLLERSQASKIVKLTPAP